MPADPFLDCNPPAPQISVQWFLKQIVCILRTALGSTNTLSVRVANGASFDIPQFDKQTFTYYGVTNNIQTQVFSLGGTTVATLTYTYVGSGASDDDKIASITQS